MENEDTQLKSRQNNSSFSDQKPELLLTTQILDCETV